MSREPNKRYVLLSHYIACMVITKQWGAGLQAPSVAATRVTG